MKRCPQCEFIYEDEQLTCDMDGAILALDKSGASSGGGRSAVKSFAVPAVMVMALAAVLFLAFYSSPLIVAKPDARQLSPGQVPVSPVPAPTPVLPAIEVSSPAPSPDALSEPGFEEAATIRRTSEANHANPSTSDSRLTIKRELPPLPRIPTLARLPPARVRQTSTTKGKVPTKISQPKKQSTVGSFLKKTGRVITKPFKF